MKSTHKRKRRKPTRIVVGGAIYGPADDSAFSWMRLTQIGGPAPNTRRRGPSRPTLTRPKKKKA